MDLGKRTCFRMTGGPSGEFIMAYGKMSVRTLNARFGMGTCPASDLVAAALTGKGIGICGGGRDIALLPGKMTACGLGQRAVGTSMASSVSVTGC